jgi:hypothetical protein
MNDVEFISAPVRSASIRVSNRRAWRAASARAPRGDIGSRQADLSEPAVANSVTSCLSRLLGKIRERNHAFASRGYAGSLQQPFCFSRAIADVSLGPKRREAWPYLLPPRLVLSRAVQLHSSRGGLSPPRSLLRACSVAAEPLGRFRFGHLKNRSTKAVFKFHTTQEWLGHSEPALRRSITARSILGRFLRTVSRRAHSTFTRTR